MVKEERVVMVVGGPYLCEHICHLLAQLGT